MVSFKLKILIGFVLTLITFSTLSVYTYLNNTAQLETTNMVTHTIEVLYAAQTLSNDLLDAETNHRGYLISGEGNYLAAYRKSVKAIDEDVNHLEQLTSDNVKQQSNIKTRLVPLITSRIEIFGKVVEARQRGFDNSRSAFVSEGGLKVMNDIRAVILDIQGQEESLLKDRRELQQEKAALFSVTYISFGTGIVFVLLLMFYMIYRYQQIREKIERDLQKASHDLRDLYDNAPCGYFSINDHLCLASVNQTLLNWLGYTPEEVVDKMSYKDLLSLKSGEAFKVSFTDDFEHLKTQGYVADREIEFARKDGSILPVIVNSSAAYDDSGKFVRSRSSVFDNTAKKKAEKERDDFFNNSLDLLVILSLEGEFLNWNAMWATTLGYDDAELQRKSIDEFIHAEDVSTTSVFLKEKLTTGQKVISFENRFKAKDGSYHWLQWSAVPLVDKGIVYGFARDITQQKISNERIIQLNRELEAFTYSVSHDLRAPLRSITGFAQILKEDYGAKLDDEGVRITEVIMKSARQMGQLIDDLLDFSRIGRKDLSKSMLNMRQMVEDIIREQSQENKKPSNIKVHPLKTSIGDVNMLRVVWTNLISNALKYSRKKDVIEVEIGSYDENGVVCYYIFDKGAGFDMRFVDKLFDVFQRLHKSNEFEGTGIGLALVKRIIHRHGGKVWAEGKVNDGAKFYFTLPN